MSQLVRRFRLSGGEKCQAFTFLVLFAACCVCVGLKAAEGDRFLLEMENRIAKWETAGLRKAWTNEPFAESYEFFLWDKENDSLQWFVVQVASESRPEKVIIQFGNGEIQSGSKTLDPSRADRLLSEIGKSELFRLPTIVGDTNAPRVTFANTGLAFFLGRRKQGNRSHEVFRWIGESYPVDKVIDALTVTITH